VVGERNPIFNGTVECLYRAANLLTGISQICHGRATPFERTLGQYSVNLVATKHHSLIHVTRARL
jgi:hypothetical protein